MILTRYEMNQIQMKGMADILSFLTDRIKELSLILEVKDNEETDYSTSHEILELNKDFKKEVQSWLLSGERCQ